MSDIYKRLKEKQRSIRDGFPINLGLRVHRALSWFNRAEMAKDDPDAAFIFLWIAFNAAYAEDVVQLAFTGERTAFDDYFGKLIELDKRQAIYEAIWKRFSGSIRMLIDNKYVFSPFWSYPHEVPGYDDWEDRFHKSKVHLHKALQNHDTRMILATVFDRLYVLRNQIVHGGATWNSSVNRSQIRDGHEILAFLVPLFIDLMMDNPDKNWGAPYYPVIE